MIATSQFESIVHLKDDTLRGLAQWSPAEVSYKPSPSEWSALEIVDHLARTDASITAQLRRNAAAPLPLTMVNRAAGSAFNRMFRSSIRVKTPASASAILPSAPSNLATAAAAWDLSIIQLRHFLEGLDVLPLGGLFQHFVAGPMSLTTALDFIETHTRHHLHQLARVRRAANSGA